MDEYLLIFFIYFYIYFCVRRIRLVKELGICVIEKILILVTVVFLKIHIIYIYI